MFLRLHPETRKDSTISLLACHGALIKAIGNFNKVTPAKYVPKEQMYEYRFFHVNKLLLTLHVPSLFIGTHPHRLAYMALTQNNIPEDM